ncbi:MAG: prepilin-type N-terminal cleavage/methylation domain-containing protein [Candidatus Taylorbacteria bacterium]
MKGFTIIEMIIVLAVISVVSMVTAPLGLQFFNGQTIAGMQGQLGDTFTRARSQSIAQKDDSSYGVCLNTTASSTTSYVLYTGGVGSACSSHNTATDELYAVQAGTLITFPGSTTIPEINFAKHTGTPTATGTISVVWNGFTKTLTIDSLGTIVEN